MIRDSFVSKAYLLFERVWNFFLNFM